MGGTLEISEQEVWMPAGWVFDDTLERVGNELLPHDRNLAEMFLQATTESSGGLLHVTPEWKHVRDLAGTVLELLGSDQYGAKES